MYIITLGELSILIFAVFLVLLKSVTPLLLVYQGLKELLESPREVLAARGTLEAVC